MSQIDGAAIDADIEAKQLESEEVREATRRGVALRNPSGSRTRSTNNATLELLSGILDEAVRRKVLATTPAREKGLRLKEQRTRGNILGIDELADLVAAAAELDQRVAPEALERGAAARALRGQGITWKRRRPAPRRV